eukprot:SRR837773.16681.p1 GENE.SRR837773.16681~~SRR837773.16681.p1  ORF type:complete len:206 (-),score=34.55 SRR837773.16681:70-654(-)
MGKDFFQSSSFGWLSVAAWFKSTNRVIGGCGVDLFDQSYETQTRCILGRVVDRSEPYNVVGSCMAQHMPEVASSTPMPSPPATTLTTTLAPTPAPMPATTVPASTDPCVPVLDCSAVDFCDAAGYTSFCSGGGGTVGECPAPFCERRPAVAALQAVKPVRRGGRRQSFLGTALLQVQGTLGSTAPRESDLSAEL